jgi:hypothetical protein
VHAKNFRRTFQVLRFQLLQDAVEPVNSTHRDLTVERWKLEFSLQGVFVRRLAPDVSGEVGERTEVDVIKLLLGQWPMGGKAISRCRLGMLKV